MKATTHLAISWSVIMTLSLVAETASGNKYSTTLNLVTSEPVCYIVTEDNAILDLTHLCSSKVTNTYIKQLLTSKQCAGCDLSGTHLSGANLVGANLNNANLSKADLRGANLLGANLRGANLNSANLRGAIMPDGSIHD